MSAEQAVDPVFDDRVVAPHPPVVDDVQRNVDGDRKRESRQVCEKEGEGRRRPDAGR
jgi:hypothetical protein